MWFAPQPKCFQLRFTESSCSFPCTMWAPRHTRAVGTYGTVRVDHEGADPYTVQMHMSVKRWEIPFPDRYDVRVLGGMKFCLFLFDLIFCRDGVSYLPFLCVLMPKQVFQNPAVNHLFPFSTPRFPNVSNCDSPVN